MNSCTSEVHKEKVLALEPDIFPDLKDVIIPVNIAPLNFRINTTGRKYVVKFGTADKEAFRIVSKKADILIPERKWKTLLGKYSGKFITINIYVKSNNGNWDHYKPVEIRITPDRIDPYIAYRRINAGMIFWENMEIVQRSLEDCEESDIISNQNTKYNCINCHSFGNRDPENFLLHLRMTPGGTLIKKGSKILWLNTKTPFTLSPFVYPAWHPNGRYIAFSTNKIHQNFFGTGHRNNHVRDEASDIVVYDVDSNQVFTDPQIATLDFENLPAWSADGLYLYYLQCQYEMKFKPDTSEKYDLMRISFDPDTRKWGKKETILSSKVTGMSISFPQISPDGRYLVFCMADYGYFDINNTSSDLYLMKLPEMTYTKPDINSNKTESFPSWSDNSRWLMFTSKRIDGLYTIPHFSYIDSTGNASKPFPLPMKDPQAYFTQMTNFNRPVFVKGKVLLTQNEIQEIVCSKNQNVVFDTIGVDIDGLTKATVTNPTTHETGVPYMRD
jgi:hypothetical protein